MGNVSAPDPDVDDSVSFTLAKGTGDTDNNNFRLDKRTGVLTSRKVFDFEVKSRYNIRVAAKDTAGHVVEAELTVTVNNINDTPMDLSLEPSPPSIQEKLPAGRIVGRLDVNDPDKGQSWETHTFSLVEGAGDTQNVLFSIDGDTLKSAVSLDHKSTPTASVRIRTTDAAGASLEANFEITVEDQNDPPNEINLSNNSVEENLSSRYSGRYPYRI